MPIDRELLRNKYEGEVDSLLKNRTSQIGQKLNGISANIESTRPKLFNQASSFASALTGGPVADGSGLSTTRLQRAMNERVSTAKRTQNLDRMNLLYNNALRRATEAGASRQQAEQYAVEAARAQAQRDFTENENAKDQQSQIYKENISNVYGGQGLSQMQQSFAEQQASSAYQQALYRSLFGLAGSLGTSYALNRYGSNPTPGVPSTPAASTTNLPYGPSQNWGFYPQRATGGYQ